MLKKIGIPLIALVAVLVLIAAPQAQGSESVSELVFPLTRRILPTAAPMGITVMATRIPMATRMDITATATATPIPMRTHIRTPMDSASVITGADTMAVIAATVTVPGVTGVAMRGVHL
jgi:hypothetical protein